MTTSRKMIDLSKLYDTRSLATRDAAKAVARRIRESAAREVCLDFRAISSASLSFLDQLVAERARMPDRQVVFVNMNASIQEALRVIERRKTGAQRSESRPASAAPPI